MEEPLTVKRALDAASEAADTLSYLTETYVPPSVRDYVAGNWASAAYFAGDYYLKHIPLEEMQTWGRRVISVERAAKILADFEDAIVKEYSANPQEVIVRSFMRVAHSTEFVIGNIGLLIIIFHSLVKVFWQLVSDVGTGIGKLLSLWWEGKTNFLTPFEPGTMDDEVEDTINDLTEKAIEDVAIPFWEGIELIVATGLMKAVAGVASGEAIHHALQPVGVQLDRAVADLQSSAFPQRRRVAVRRRRRTRG